MGSCSVRKLSVAMQPVLTEFSLRATVAQKYLILFLCVCGANLSALVCWGWSGRWGRGVTLKALRGGGVDLRRYVALRGRSGWGVKMVIFSVTYLLNVP